MCARGSAYASLKIDGCRALIADGTQLTARDLEPRDIVDIDGIIAIEEHGVEDLSVGHRIAGGVGYRGFKIHAGEISFHADVGEVEEVCLTHANAHRVAEHIGAESLLVGRAGQAAFQPIIWREAEILQLADIKVVIVVIAEVKAGAADIAQIFKCQHGSRLHGINAAVGVDKGDITNGQTVDIVLVDGRRVRDDLSVGQRLLGIPEGDVLHRGMRAADDGRFGAVGLTLAAVNAEDGALCRAGLEVSCQGDQGGEGERVAQAIITLRGIDGAAAHGLDCRDGGAEGLGVIVLAVAHSAVGKNIDIGHDVVKGVIFAQNAPRAGIGGDGEIGSRHLQRGLGHDGGGIC